MHIYRSKKKNTTSPKLVVILSRKLIVFKGIYPFKKECPCAFKEKLHPLNVSV